MSESEEVEKKSSQSVLSEEELEQLKQHTHANLSTSITFAEVVQIVNGMLVNEVNERINAMSEEELVNNYKQLKDLLENSDSEKASVEQG